MTFRVLGFLARKDGNEGPVSLWPQTATVFERTKPIPPLPAFFRGERYISAMPETFETEMEGQATGLPLF